MLLSSLNSKSSELVLLGLEGLSGDQNHGVTHQAYRRDESWVSGLYKRIPLGWAPGLCPQRREDGLAVGAQEEELVCIPHRPASQPYLLGVSRWAAPQAQPGLAEAEGGGAGGPPLL